ncbi:hypothetical protein Plano_2896 [Planococcus sp. PAMC 21323]|nr:hypothetical protein Plano_2896 [Planococcus sp. PAMC 21323]
MATRILEYFNVIKHSSLCLYSKHSPSCIRVPSRIPYHISQKCP